MIMITKIIVIIRFQILAMIIIIMNNDNLITKMKITIRITLMLLIIVILFVLQIMNYEETMIIKGIFLNRKYDDDQSVDPTFIFLLLQYKHGSAHARNHHVKMRTAT